MVPVCFVFRWEFMKFSSDITFVCSSQLYLRHPAPGKAASRSSAESAARHVTSYTFGLSLVSSLLKRPHGNSASPLAARRPKVPPATTTVATRLPSSLF